MKRRHVNIEWFSMTGLGPRAWDRDESRPAMHSTREHPSGRHSIVHHDKGRGPAGAPHKAASGK